MPSPCINGGVAWDNSVGLIDADEGHDTYAYNLSTGLGRADSVGWGLFIDEGRGRSLSGQSRLRGLLGKECGRILRFRGPWHLFIPGQFFDAGRQSSQ
jgi:hypothetical protein